MEIFYSYKNHETKQYTTVKRRCWKSFDKPAEKERFLVGI